MEVPLTTFTPLAGLIGGLLIGFSAVILMTASGRIMGASGIFAGFCPSSRTRTPCGVPSSSSGCWPGQRSPPGRAGSIPRPYLHKSLGPPGRRRSRRFGTWTGSGCTSGHGICGLSRLSARSLAATMTFMLVAIATVFVVRHVLGG